MKETLGRIFAWVVIILICSALFGGGFAFWDYYRAATASSSHRRHEAVNDAMEDTAEAMKRRFAIGSIVGAAAGAVFMWGIDRKVYGRSE
ncbi:MAG: hypothetical protein KGZ25_06715 [Planctomycetes bacterium]|nr:hypothetical protein [Planctomycetota bacterium]